MCACVNSSVAHCINYKCINSANCRAITSPNELLFVLWTGGIVFLYNLLFTRLRNSLVITRRFVNNRKKAQHATRWLIRLHKPLVKLSSLYKLVNSYTPRNLLVLLYYHAVSSNAVSLWPLWIYYDVASFHLFVCFMAFTLNKTRRICKQKSPPAHLR